MRTDAEIRSCGFQALMTALGTVEAERFITLMGRERIDYTEWRRNQWDDESVTSLIAQARILRREQETEPQSGI